MVTSAYVYAFINSEGKECQENPFVYGAKKVAEAEKDTVSCNCQIGDDFFNSFSFNQREMNVSKRAIFQRQETIIYNHSS